MVGWGLKTSSLGQQKPKRSYRRADECKYIEKPERDMDVAVDVASSEDEK